MPARGSVDSASAYVLGAVLDLSRFLQHYTPDAGANPPPAMERPPRTASSLGLPVTIQELLVALGGTSFNRGIYKLHRLEDVTDWNATIAAAWSLPAGRVCCFGYDWEGRQFALHGSKVLQFSAGDLEFVEIPMDLAVFHNEVLVSPDLAEAALAVEFYRAWLASGGAVPEFGNCAGYVKPLFLGGSDWIDNLELIDLEVYWHLSAPLVAEARRVGVGGIIARIEIGD